MFLLGGVVFPLRGALVASTGHFGGPKRASHATEIGRFGTPRSLEVPTWSGQRGQWNLHWTPKMSGPGSSDDFFAQRNDTHRSKPQIDANQATPRGRGFGRDTSDLASRCIGIIGLWKVSRVVAFV